MSDATQHSEDSHGELAVTLAQRITPGPWRIMNSHKAGFLNVYATHDPQSTDSVACDFICEIGPGARQANTEANANAELIALAPTLLAQRDALQAQVSQLCAALSRHGRHDDACVLRHEANLPGDSRCTCGFSSSLT